MRTRNIVLFAAFFSFLIIALVAGSFMSQPQVVIKALPQTQQVTDPTATPQPKAEQQFAIQNNTTVMTDTQTETSILANIPEKTVINNGDTINGVTYTSIVGENGLNSLIVREKRDNKIISFTGYNGNGSSKGGKFSASFNKTMTIKAIICWDNDPKGQEKGWSITTSDGRTATCPKTADREIVRIELNWSNVDSFVINAGGDSGGISIITTTNNITTTTISTPSNDTPVSLPRTAGQLEVSEAEALVAQAPWLYTRPIGGKRLVEYLEYNN